MPLAPGTRLGPYEIVELAGTGGMGEVYKAHDTRLRRAVALKIATRPFADDRETRAQFEREARTIAALNHPHICAIHDVASFDGQDVIVMEYLDGETLQQRLRRGPLSLAELLRHAIAIAEALAAAHREGVVHRDLKPSNVMLTRSGVKLLDFGIAKRRKTAGDATVAPDATGSTVATLEGRLVGTVPYMAPEQLEGRPVDARTDIFAFGAVLFEMAAGKPAFQGESTAALVAAILAEQRPRVSAIVPGLPRAVDRAISACLALKPEDRWQNAADLLRELRWCEADLAEPEVAGGRARAGTWRLHALWAAALVTAVVAVLWNSSRAGPGGLPPPNARPVVVLMDSPLPGRVYDPRTEKEGGTNADDLTDVLRNLPVTIHKENTSAVWHREEQVLEQNPDLIVAHLSCLFDARVAGDQKAVYEHLFDLAENRVLLFLAYVASSNPRTRFLLYSRSRFEEKGGEQTWIASQEARLPVLRGRLSAFTVPGGVGVAKTSGVVSS
jgi:tRNA A-37 threonylcarbamoyl transferase component Bud32